MNIRNARQSDAAALAAIYNHYIQNTSITFETEPIGDEEMVQRITNVQTLALPWLIAEQDDKIIGYAYANLWKTRAAYHHTVEISIYLDANRLSKGMGSTLFRALLDALPDHVHAVVACVALPNEKSERMNERLGFTKVGEFKEVGFKHGQWVNVGYWQLLR